VKPVADETEPRDVDLVLRCQRGEQAAFGQLVERYQDRVYNTCYRMCHNHADALDLTQSAFLKAFEALPRFQARASFFTWLFRITVNVALSHRRSQRRRPRLALRGPDDEDHPLEPAARDGAGDPAEQVAEPELRQRLEAALDRLDDDFRAAVVLRDIEELDYADIAAILKVPVGTVKSRIHRGRLMLRHLLEQQERQRGIG